MPDIGDVPDGPLDRLRHRGAARPGVLLPIYQAASDRYGLGPQGPAILAAINQIETNFGELNRVTSYAGAIGWMQFMPATWEAYGVDADGDGIADPYDPEDAIFAAANYLSASGMPEDTYDAIFAYNHADWYVADVLANASCYGSFGDGTFSLLPQLPVLACEPAPAWRKDVPDRLPRAPSSAPPRRYDLGRRGVWALAAVARLESDFGRGMNKQQLRASGPLGLDRERVEALRGRRRRGRPGPPRQHRGLGRHAGADDLVARRPARRRLHPQPGGLVRGGGPRRGRPPLGRLQDDHRRLAPRRCRR